MQALEAAKVNVVQVKRLNTGKCIKIEGLAGKAVQANKTNDICQTNSWFGLWELTASIGKKTINGTKKYNFVFKIFKG